MRSAEVHWWRGTKKIEYKLEDVEELTEATEENVKRIGGTVGWGAAGAVLLGPVDLLAGLLLGGRDKEVTFVCKFKDGKKFVGTTDVKTWKIILASQL